MADFKARLVELQGSWAEYKSHDKARDDLVQDLFAMVTELSSAISKQQAEIHKLEAEIEEQGKLFQRFDVYNDIYKDRVKVKGQQGRE